MLRSGGRYVLVGQTGPHAVSVSPSSLVYKHATVIGSLSATVADYWEALQFVSAYKDRFDWDALTSQEYPLADVNEAMSRMASWEQIKPVIRF